MIDCKTSLNKGFRFIFNLIDKFLKYTWVMPLINKNAPTITNEFSKFGTKSNDHYAK